MPPKHPKRPDKKKRGRRTTVLDAPSSRMVHPLTGDVLERLDDSRSCWLDRMAGMADFPDDAEQQAVQAVIYRRDTLERDGPDTTSDMCVVEGIFHRLDAGRPLHCVGCPHSIASPSEVAAVMIITPFGAIETDLVTGCLCNDCSSSLITREALQQLILQSFPGVAKVQWSI